MSKSRKLQQFKITESMGDGFELDSIITIAGVYESTKWEAFWSRTWYRLLPIRSRWYRVSGYFSNLWDAICGRRCDY